MVSHVAVCKNMYENHAFGDASLRWTDPLAYHAGEINRLRALREGPSLQREAVGMGAALFG